MMRTLGGLILLSAIALAGCSGGNSMMNPAPNNSVPVNLMMKDMPPAGVTVLAFEITVTGVSLQPAGMSGAVSLINSPVKVELENLQTGSAFLSTGNVPPGTYDSISITFANPEMTILNQSGQTVTAGGATCLDGQICRLEPQLNTASTSTSTAPFPLMLSATSGISLVLDFDVNSSIQTDLSISPSVSFTESAAQQPGDDDDVDDLVGSVTAIGSNQFTLMDNSTGNSFTVLVNSSTEFDFDHENGDKEDDDGCQANNLSCLQVGQIVKVDLNVSSNGSLVAKKVEGEEDQGEQEAEGTVVSVNPQTNSFSIVVLDREPNIDNVSVGNPVSVTVQAGANFQIDNNGLNVPNGLSFAGIQDVLVGQDIQVRSINVSSGAGTVTISTDRVRLRESQFTATVSAVNSQNFTVNNLSGLFASASISQIQVDTSSQTNFNGDNGASSVAVGNTVSLRGLLFQSAGGPVLIADQVRLR
jgi:uncharacterized protein DUF5666/uncharacterized protein DUF4382